jgi:AbrB family looped-hinge helix DNA binding protein
MQKEAKITSKGQITVPIEVREALGVQPGDKLVFESYEEGIRVRPVREESPFAKFRAIGNEGIASGRRGIGRWIRETRGK